MAELPYPLRAWLVVESGSSLKMCPQCGETALEGEEECSKCGLHPTDDGSWRIAGRLPLSHAHPIKALTGRRGAPVWTGQESATTEVERETAVRRAAEWLAANPGQVCRTKPFQFIGGVEATPDGAVAWLECINTETLEVIHSEPLPVSRDLNPLVARLEDAIHYRPDTRHLLQEVREELRRLQRGSYALAMAILQSDSYPHADAEVRAEVQAAIDRQFPKQKEVSHGVPR